ncbi:MAG: MBL fold metallo-hydrolase [Saprospiraceae bacterium]
MTIRLLGTGTSQGIPLIGCDCEVCLSQNPKDKRLRTAALITGDDNTKVVIDAGPDFRQQMLLSGTKHLDAILLTHEHNDHVIGLDDIRPFNYHSGAAISVHALPRVADEVKHRFAYIFGKAIPGLPQIELHTLDEETPIHIKSLTIQPIGVWHGRLPILSFRIGDLAYLTDVKSVEESQFQKLIGVRYLIVNALHHREHPTHFNLTEALAFIEKVQPEKAWLIHLSHHMGLTEDVEKLLPPNVSLGYDGLEIEF